MIDINTTNTSFIEIHNLLKSKGVSNNDFMLKLNNEKLLNLDPYSPTLSLEDKVMIYLECVQNPMYFFRELIRIPPFYNGGTDGGIKFILNQANSAQLYLNINNKCSFDMYCRQSLKIMTALCTMAYNFLFKIDYEQKIIGANAKHALKLISIIDHLPDYITQYKRYKHNNSGEISMIANTINNNKITISGRIKDQEDYMESIGTANRCKFILIDDMNIYESTLCLWQSLAPSMYYLDGVTNIVGIYFDNKFVRTMLLSNKRWTNDLYDADISELDRLYVVHFEPEEIIGEENTNNMLKVLNCKSKEDDLFVKEMCTNIPYFK